MLKSEMQHQFWITKKTVQRKLGSKEDKHVISSDAELDAKIEVFKSISDTSEELSKIIDQYQERLCVLSQEECVFGRFLKEVGKRSKTTGQSITNTGKAVSYSSQQRMCVRVPLLRLQHEVEVFRCRAVRDTYNTIQSMEKERTEYRAALSWMKSASCELDPDTGKGLDKFRTAQSHVRMAKQNFDGLSLDSIQKIDLLAASRCNMYSLALVSYITEMRNFAQKTWSTFDVISKSLLEKPKYDFCVLKDLTQTEGNETEEINKIVTVDKDQSLFFAEEYVDEEKKENPTISNLQRSPHQSKHESILIELNQQDDNTLLNKPDDEWSKILTDSQSKLTNSTCQDNSEYEGNWLEETPKSNISTEKRTNRESFQNRTTNKLSPWMDLFADLDPLANPEAFDLKLNGGRTNFQQT